MRKTLTVIAVIAVVLLIGAGVVRWQNTRETEGPGPGPQPTDTLGGGETTPGQPDWCPEVEFISAPGTWESAADDDPIHPQANPESFMLKVSAPLQERYPEGQVKVWTLPYTAQFRNINADHEMSYDQSRQEGTAKLKGELKLTHDQCPQTDFVLAGVSQGAVIVGDVVAEIGTGQGIIPAERVRGAAVVADGRRVPGVGVVPGTQVSGVGAEVALAPLSKLVQPIVPGATMRGERVGGFGELNDRTMDICAPDDSICDAPRDVGNALGRARELVEANGVHALYAYNEHVVPGTTTDQWLIGWAQGLIDQ